MNEEKSDIQPEISEYKGKPVMRIPVVEALA